MKSINAFILFIVVFFISSCGDEKSKINNDIKSTFVEMKEASANPAWNHDIKYTKGMTKEELENKIIDEVNKHSWNQISDRYVVYGNSSIDDAEIILIGDIHNSYNINLDNTIFIDEFYDYSNTVILREDDAVIVDSREWNNYYWIDFINMIGGILSKKELCRYDPLAAPHYQLKRLRNLHKIHMGSWDISSNWCGHFKSRGITADFNRDDCDHKSLLYRNIHMAIMIEEKLNRYKRVMVEAGVAHLPVNEYLIFKEHYRQIYGKKSNVSIGEYFNDINKYVGTVRSRMYSARYDGMNTTKELYDFLETKKYVMLYHKTITPQE